MQNTTAKHSERLLVILADGGQARMLVRGERPGSYRTQRMFHLPPVLADAWSDPDHVLPGGFFERVGLTRHEIAVAAPEQVARQDFMAEVARHVNDAASAGVFDRLVLVAPPAALHDLRLSLSTVAADRLAGLFPKDLVGLPDDEIGAHLGLAAAGAL